MYQVPIFRELNRLTSNYLVLFGSDLSLRKTYFKEISSTFSPDTPGLLNGYNYKFLKNFGKEKYHFFSRINPAIFKYIINKKTTHILVHGYDNITTLFSMIFAKIVGVKVIWRGEVIPHKQKKITKFILSLILKKFVDIHLYSCEGNKNFLKNLGIICDKNNFIKCSVDNSFFKGKLKNNRIHKSKKFTIIFSGRMINRKRPFDIISALKILNNKDIHVIWLGDGPLRNDIENETKLLANTSSFPGFVNQSSLHHYYLKADIAVVPSQYDPSPKVINELLNFNIPSLASKGVGTANELTFSDEDVFEIGDIKHIASRIDFYFKNKSSLQNQINFFAEQKLKEYNPAQNASVINNLIH